VKAVCFVAEVVWVMAASDRGPNQPNRVGAICLRSVARHNGILNNHYFLYKKNTPEYSVKYIFLSFFRQRKKGKKKSRKI
jgi:hypothetical protein